MRHGVSLHHPRPARRTSAEKFSYGWECEVELGFGMTWAFPFSFLLGLLLGPNCNPDMAPPPDTSEILFSDYILYI